MLRFTNRHLGLTVVGGVALMLAACTAGSDRGLSDPPPANPGPPTGQCGALGKFSGNATGAVGATGATMSGCSFFYVGAVGDGTQAFGLMLSDGAMASPTHRIYLGRTGARPDVGTYRVGDGEFFGLFTVIADNGNFAVIADNHEFKLNGTLTITSSSEAGVDGTLSLTGTDAAGVAIAISGTFSAKCAQVNGSAC